MLKEIGVVMLPTNNKAVEKGQLVLCPDGFLMQSWSDVKDSKGYKPQHLYITSDEKPVNDDWCIQNGNYLCKITCNQDRTSQELKKIIATTDKLLTISEIIYPEEFVHVMPSPSDGFIKKFIEKYNAGTPITEVMVKYEDNGEEDWHGDDANGEPFWNEKWELKVDKNNCITILPVKESWTREELPIEIMKDMLRYCEVNQIYDKLSNFGDFYYKGKKWIEQNL